MSIRVLIVDDSALVRQLLREILNSDPDIEVVGYASDPYIARDKIKRLNPDVLTLDVEMPRMDGISFLRNIMRLRPMPVVMVSSLTREGADETLEALALGAVDFVAKPERDLAESLREYSDEIITKVKVAAQARVRPAEEPRPRSRISREVHVPEIAPERQDVGVELIALGASTGGVEAIKELLEKLPADLPGMVIVQHIPKEFSRAFAERINRSSELTVKEAEDGDEIRPGHVYIAPGNRHLLVARRGKQLLCRVSDAERVNQHRPSVDVLFHSVAEVLGREAVGILLTGMGADGAQGLRSMQASGAVTIAQDEQTSVIWGMPREAILMGCVDHVLPLLVIPDYLRDLVSNAGAPAAECDTQSGSR